MICKKCGATISDTSKFCGYCGAPNKEDALNSNQVLPEVNINNLNNGVNVNPVSPVDTLNETSVQKNNLNSDVSIRFIDNNGKCVIESQIDKSKCEEIGELSQGEYEMQIDVTKGLEGNLEISFNEE